MKELSIEEKAKAYDKAIERARKYYEETSNNVYKSMLEQIFPELKESEDEKIRKELIETIHLAYDCGCSLNKEQRDKYLAWIEKQGEQKPTKLAKGENYGIDGLHAAIDILQQTLGKVDGYQTDDGILLHECAISAVKQLYEQKSVWSEEDEKIISDAEVWLDTLCDYLKDSSSAYIPNVRAIISKLKSLKDRVQPQPKQEWSEEDEDMCYKATAVMNRLCAEGKEYVWSINTLKKLYYWLKDLKDRVQPQSHWKPSDEQMECLSDAIKYYNSLGYPASKLKELLEDLKKLKG